MVGLGCAVERLPRPTGRCLAPDGLNSRAPMATCPSPPGETSATLRGVDSRHVSPSHPEHQVTGRIWSYPPPRAITRRRIRRQFTGSGHPEPRGADTPTHAYRSEPNGPHPTVTRSRWAWHAISHNVNTTPLQCAPNLFNLLLIHATNTDTTIDLTVTVLHNFELKRDTVQTKNDFPAQ